MMRVLIPSHSEPNEYPIFFSGSSLTPTEAGPEGNRDSWCPDFYQHDPVSRRPAPTAKPVHLAASSASMDSTTDSPTDSPTDSRKYRKRRFPSMPSDSFRCESTETSDREVTDLSDERLKSSLETPRELNCVESSDEVGAAKNILTAETDLSGNRLKSSLDTPRELNSVETSGESGAAKNILTGEKDISGNRLKSSLDRPRENPVESSDEIAENEISGRPGSQPDNDSSPSGRKWGLKRLSYNYPLNQAIQANASLEVLEAIIPVAPEALLLPDGQEQELALHVLVRHRPCERVICDMLLLKSPAAAAFTDRYKNTALHVACSSGACIDIVRHLCAVNPHAIEERNFHGLTPLDIAVRRNTCSEEVVDYLTQSHLSLCRAFDDE